MKNEEEGGEQIVDVRVMKRSGRVGVQSAMSQPQVLSQLVQLALRFRPGDAQLRECVLVLLRSVPLVLSRVEQRAS